MIKKLIITVIVLFLGIPYVSAKEAGGCVILQHNGNETFFEAKDVQAAMDAAVEGDTLMFSAESSIPRFTMNKKVFIISTGILYIDVDIPGNPSLDECLFQTFEHWIDITVKSDLQKLYLCDTFVFVNVGNYNVHVGMLEMERCHCWGVWYNSDLKNLIANNCLIQDNFWGEGLQSATFNNCRIEISGLEVENATFNNSILYLRDADENPSTFTACTFNNCLMNADNLVLDEGSTKTDCYDLDKDTYSSEKDYLTANKYFGNDGTVVGELGGTNPYVEGHSIDSFANIYNVGKKGNKMSVRMYVNNR